MHGELGDNSVVEVGRGERPWDKDDCGLFWTHV
jgi:hypothetical protein